MFDARIFVDDLQPIKETLIKSGALYKGEYFLHDFIFASRDEHISLDDTYLRLRFSPHNIWGDSPYLVSIKNTKLQAVGKISDTSLKKGFETESEARKYIEEMCSGTFYFLFDFTRIGWQYDLGDDQIDLEDIEGHYSVECKSPTEDGLHHLLARFNFTDVIKGPSVTTMKKLLRK